MPHEYHSEEMFGIRIPWNSKDLQFIVICIFNVIKIEEGKI